MGDEIQIRGRMDGELMIGVGVDDLVDGPEVVGDHGLVRLGLI